MSILLAKLLNYRSAWPGDDESRLRRFVTLSGRTIGWLLIHILLATAITLPFTETANAWSWSKPAPTGLGTDSDSDQSPSAWHNWANDPSHWTTYPAIGVAASPVAVPMDNFQLLGTGTFTPGATGGVDVSAEMISGDKWITLGQETVGTAGISSQQISSAMHNFPKNSAYIFAQYSPENATGRIAIQKVEKMPNGVINVYQADFTPWSGRLWKAQGKYRTATEIASGAAGYNPFAIFENVNQDETDPVFYHISLPDLGVAVGHAMRRYGVAFAYVAVDQERMDVSSITKQHLFENKIETTTTGYAKPVWWVGTPIEAALAGAKTGQICVTGGAGAVTASCDDPAHVAIAGVVFSPMTGGNMPQNEDTMYQSESNQYSWNVFAFATILTVLTWGLSSFLDPVILAAAGGAGGLAGGVSGAYALGTAGGNITNLNLSQSQQRPFSSTGNGWAAPMLPGSPDQQNIMTSIQANHITDSMGSGGMSGTDQLYKGACPPYLSVAACRSSSLDPGTIWRPDSYADYNSTKAMRLRYDACVAQGYTGAQAEQCAAPTVGAIQ